MSTDDATSPDHHRTPGQATLALRCRIDAERLARGWSKTEF